MTWSGAAPSSPVCSSRASPLGDGRLACVVGIGVNCASAPTGLAYSTAHLTEILGRAVAPEDLFARLALRFEEALGLWRHGAGFAAIRTLWLAHAAGLGDPIRISDAQGLREGIFNTLDEQGRLVLNSAKGSEIIEAGDLFLIKDAAS